MDLFVDKIFGNDALYMKSLIGRTVKITIVDEDSVSGTVYAIDPIYKTVVLHTNKTGGGKHDTVFVLHHAIKSLEVLPDAIDESYLERTLPVCDSAEAMLQKKRLKKWLQQMNINVDEVGDYLKIHDHLLIMPPYGIDNFICNNMTVLEKIRNIVSLMPKDFN